MESEPRQTLFRASGSSTSNKSESLPNKLQSSTLLLTELSLPILLFLPRKNLLHDQRALAHFPFHSARPYWSSNSAGSLSNLHAENGFLE